MDHVLMFAWIPPLCAVNEVMRRVKGRNSRKFKMEFPEPRKRFWGQHFWARGQLLYHKRGGE